VFLVFNTHKGANNYLTPGIIFLYLITRTLNDKIVNFLKLKIIRGIILINTVEGNPLLIKRYIKYKRV